MSYPSSNGNSVSWAYVLSYASPERSADTSPKRWALGGANARANFNANDKPDVWTDRNSDAVSVCRADAVAKSTPIGSAHIDSVTCAFFMANNLAIVGTHTFALAGADVGAHTIPDAWRYTEPHAFPTRAASNAIANAPNDTTANAGTNRNSIRKTFWWSNAGTNSWTDKPANACTVLPANESAYA
jgi:hypothetical protein